MQAPWASQFEVAATAVTAATNGMRHLSAWMGDFAVAATAINLGDLVGSRRRTVL